MTQIDLDLDLLRCFLVVAELRSFTAAGDRIGRSQSAVSIRIKKLEEIFGAELFERSSRDVVLTSAGRKLLPKAKQILGQGESLVAEMRGSTVSGSLRVGFLEYVGPHRVPELLTALARRVPDAVMSFQIGLSRGLLAALDAGQLDIALGVYDPARPDGVVLAHDPLVWVESATAPRHLSQSVDMCVMRGACLYRDRALKALTQAEIPFREAVTADSILGVRQAVASGLGVTLLGRSALGEGVRISDRMASVPISPPLTLALYGSDPRKTQLADVFRDLLKDELMVQ